MVTCGNVITLYSLLCLLFLPRLSFVVTPELAGVRRTQQPPRQTFLPRVRRPARPGCGLDGCGRVHIRAASTPPSSPHRSRRLHDHGRGVRVDALHRAHAVRSTSLMHGHESPRGWGWRVAFKYGWVRAVEFSPDRLPDYMVEYIDVSILSGKM